MNFYLTYIEGNIELKGGELMKYFFLFLYLFSCILNYFTNDKNKELRRKLLYIIAIATVLPFVFNSLLSIRISGYFNIYYCILLADLYKNTTQAMKIFIISILSIYFISNIYVSSLNRKSSYTPYEMIFFNDRSDLKW
jgi:uncharacterized membrane protein